MTDLLKKKIFSDELNKRITCVVDDEDYPNEGSIIAGLVQEEVFNYLNVNQVKVPVNLIEDAVASWATLLNRAENTYPKQDYNLGENMAKLNEWLDNFYE